MTLTRPLLVAVATCAVLASPATAAPPGPTKIVVPDSFGNKTRQAWAAESEGRSFIAFLGHAGEVGGRADVRVFEVTPDWRYVRLPNLPSTSNARNAFLRVAAVGGRPCVGYGLDDSNYVACLDPSGAWQELPFPGGRRADVFTDLVAHRGVLYAMTAEEVGFGPGAERYFHVLRRTGEGWDEPAPPLRFPGRPPKWGPTGIARFGTSDGPSPVVGVMDSWPNPSYRRVLSLSGAGWTDVVPPVRSSWGGSLSAGPVVRAGRVVMSDSEARPHPLHFTVLSGTLGTLPRRFGTRAINRPGRATQGGIHFAAGRYWALWVDAPAGRDADKKRSQLLAATVLPNARRVGRPQRLLNRKVGGLFPPGQIFELRGHAYAFAPPLTALGRGPVPLIQRLDR